MKLDDAIRDLEVARKRLVDEQGRIARRNARRAVMAALKKARAALDTEYPAERKPVAKRKKPNPRRKYRGKVEIEPIDVRELLLSGVKPSAFTRAHPGGTRIYAPSWMVRAMRAGIDPKLIAKAVRSQKVRKQIDGLIRLRGKPTPENTAA